MHSALLTDLYQLTMSYAYWKLGMHEYEATFHLYFRRNPFKGNYTIACGLQQVVAYLEGYHFTESELSYLASLKDNAGNPLFETGFLAYLKDLEFSCDVAAMPEGSVCFPNEPLLRIQGPIIQCQLLETPMLNMINFQTLIATKSSRICQSAQGEPVLEFGLRRAQGPNGAMLASRAAYIGGCVATSNVLAGQQFDIPVRGTHAHSWVMAFDSETEAFERYAEAMPGNCVFLVDTYDTLQGVDHAIEVGKELAEKGYKMIGVRLDSGDLAALSKGARERLDKAGFPDAAIVASNDLDEYNVERLKSEGATINVWGIGTRLVTAFEEPALGGVYKLAAIRPNETTAWEYKMKFSAQPGKASYPGVLQTLRVSEGGKWVRDILCHAEEVARIQAQSASESEVLMIPIFEQGKKVYAQPSIHESRAYRAAQLQQLPEALLSNTQADSTYPLEVSASILELVEALTEKHKPGN